MSEFEQLLNSLVRKDGCIMTGKDSFVVFDSEKFAAGFRDTWRNLIYEWRTTWFYIEENPSYTRFRLSVYYYDSYAYRFQRNLLKLYQDNSDAIEDMNASILATIKEHAK